MPHRDYRHILFCLYKTGLYRHVRAVAASDISGDIATTIPAPMALLSTYPFCLRNALMRAIAWKKIDVRASMTAGLSEFAVVIRYEPFNVLSDRASRNMWAHCAGDPCTSVRWTIGDTDSMKSRICFGKVRAGDSKNDTAPSTDAKALAVSFASCRVISDNISRGISLPDVADMWFKTFPKNLVLILRILGLPY